MKSTKPQSIDEYIAGFPKDIHKILQQIRETVQKAAPEAEEAIKYSMPTFVLNGNLVSFAAYKNHIGFYPVPSGKAEFEKDFAAYYTSGKGTIQFPLEKPIPLGLITKIVKYNIKRNLEKKKKRKA